MKSRKILATMAIVVTLAVTMTSSVNADDVPTIIDYTLEVEETPNTVVTPQDVLTRIDTNNVTDVTTMVSKSDIDAEIENQRQMIEEETERLEQERLAAIKAQIESITADPNDISKVSNLTEEQYYILTKDTWWEGHEAVLIDLENRYHVNAMYAMSVSTLESGHGGSDRALTRNNYYGAEVDTYFASLYDNTMYFGDFQNRLYVSEGLVSVWNIGPKYCPPNRNWEVYVANKMSELLNKVKSAL